MKICTDACLFGAWVAKDLPQEELSILDIGSGTGLLMMMLAQQNSGRIDGIELDTPAYEQCRENIASHPWSNRLQVYKGDVRSYQFGGNYDCILSNPPFYENDLQPGAADNQMARHSSALRLEELVRSISKNLKSDGVAYLLIPWHRSLYVSEQAAQSGLWVDKFAVVRHSARHAPFRAMIRFKKVQADVVDYQSIYIRNNDNAYSTVFSALLKPYYLNL